MTVHGIKVIRARAAAGQPMKAWTYYRHHNMWDAYEPFVQEAHDDRLELLGLLDVTADTLERLAAATERLDPTEKVFALEQAREALARLHGAAA